MPVTFHSAPSFFSAGSTRTNFWLFPGHVNTNCVAIKRTPRQIKNTKTCTKRAGLERAGDTTYFPGHVTFRTMKDSYKRESEREGGGTERTSLFTNLTKTCFDVYIYMIKITECTADKEYKWKWSSQLLSNLSSTVTNKTQKIWALFVTAYVTS